MANTTLDNVLGTLVLAGIVGGIIYLPIRLAQGGLACS
jgi:hypothetical protein